jgi:hypothetical protein
MSQYPHSSLCTTCHAFSMEGNRDKLKAETYRLEYSWPPRTNICNEVYNSPSCSILTVKAAIGEVSERKSLCRKGMIPTVTAAKPPISGGLRADFKPDHILYRNDLACSFRPTTWVVSTSREDWL